MEWRGIWCSVGGCRPATDLRKQVRFSYMIYIQLLVASRPLVKLPSRAPALLLCALSFEQSRPPPDPTPVEPGRNAAVSPHSPHPGTLEQQIEHLPIPNYSTPSLYPLIYTYSVIPKIVFAEFVITTIPSTHPPNRCLLPTDFSGKSSMRGPQRRSRRSCWLSDVLRGYPRHQPYCRRSRGQSRLRKWRARLVGHCVSMLHSMDMPRVSVCVRRYRLCVCKSSIRSKYAGSVSGS